MIHQQERGNAAGCHGERGPARAAHMREEAVVQERLAGAAGAIHERGAAVGGVGVRREQGGDDGVKGAALVGVELREKRFRASFPHARRAAP